MADLATPPHHSASPTIPFMKTTTLFLFLVAFRNIRIAELKDK